MPQARRMHTGVSDAERAAIKREVMQEIGSVFDRSDSFDDVREHLDIADPEPLSYSDIEQMTPEQVNNDWERVSKVLSAGREFRHDPDGDDLPPAARRPTGPQPLNEHGAGSQGLTLDAIKGMTTTEINANWDEVQRVLGGRR